MSNNLKVSIIIILGVIALYISTQYYSGFNKSKTIKACIIGKAELDSKKAKEDRLSNEQIKKFCEDQILSLIHI